MMSTRARLATALLSTTVLAYVAVGSVLGRALGDSTYTQLSLFNEVTRLVMDAYIEPIDLDRTMTVASLGLTEALDGDSGYLNAQQFDAYRRAPARDSDAEIGVTLTRRYSFLMVASVRAGSPAELAGLRPGDLLKTIDGRHSRHVPAAVGSGLLRGAPGSKVSLAVLRSSTEPIDVQVVRERLLPLAPESRILEQGPAYLKIPEFGPQVADMVRSQLETLKRAGAASLVLDLRNAGRGEPAEGIKVAEMFLESGVIARLVRRKSSEQVWEAAPARQVWTGRLALLIDHGTLGAGEIVAAAVKSAQRGPLVGRRTLGRAGIRKALALGEGGLVLTVGKFLDPAGEPIHGHGVVPTERVQPRDGDDHAGQDDEEAPPKEGDAMLEKAIELLVAPAGEAAKAA